MRSIHLSVAICILILLAACKHDIPVGAGNPGTGGSGGGGTGSGGGSSLVCFQNEILPIFLGHCAKSGCHDAASHQNGYVFDSYANIVRNGITPYRAANSKVYKVLFETGNDKMPLPPDPDLSADQKALIGRWINEGAQNTTNCGSTCDTTVFTYSGAINPLLTNRCTGCHGGPAPTGGINLTTYAGVRTVALNGKLYGAVSHAPGYVAMPQNGAQLEACQITQIRKWIAAGALNN
jgi:hypothetical protein